MRRLGLLAHLIGLALLLALPAHADDVAGWKALHARYTGFTFGDGKVRTMTARETVARNGKPAEEKRWRRAGILCRIDTQNLDAHTGWSNGFTGNLFWYSDENGFTVPVIGNGAQTALAEDLIFTDAIATAPWKVARTEARDGISYVVLRVEQPHAYPIELYLDPTTGAYGRIVIDPKGAAEETLRIRGYAEPHPGIKVLSGWSVDGTDDNETSTLDDIAVNAAVSTDELHPPAPTASWTFGADTVPLHLTRNRIVIHALVNGVPGTFMLDTGAQNIYLSGAFARRAGIKPLGHLDVYSLYGKERNDSGRADTFAFGSSVLHDVALYFGSGDFDDDAPDGLIGFDLFAVSIVTVDFTASTMRIEDPQNATPPEPGVAVEADMSSGQPVVTMFLNKSLALNVLLDTGSPRYMLITGNLTSKYGLHMTGGDECGTLDDLTLGPIVYKEPYACATYPGSDRDALVGLDFLKQFARLRFDYSHSIIEFVGRKKP